MGLPAIRGLDAAKVASANLLYFATLEIVKICIQHDILCSDGRGSSQAYKVVVEQMKLCSIQHPMQWSLSSQTMEAHTNRFGPSLPDCRRGSLPDATL